MRKAESLDECRDDRVGAAARRVLEHAVSAVGLEAKPKNLESLAALQFPRSLKAMQSFLDSLNDNSRFIEDYAVYATILYEVLEKDFAARGKLARLRATNTGDAALAGCRWGRVNAAFLELKSRLATAPLLRHFARRLTSW
ncbi:hypothetical protein PybrP1_000228 [[Pythium] brassicae (nom. inval.)]|nr:hypothetical protein PybrP1_000228 [[Pythium] brassicae (nom. inval.)]